MRRVMSTAIMLALVLTATTGLALAAKNQRNLAFDEPITIGDTIVPKGSYRVRWQEQGSDVSVSFLRFGKVVAETTAKLKQLTQTTKQETVAFRGNGNGETYLREIMFVNMDQAIVFE